MTKFSILTLRDIFDEPYKLEREIIKREFKGFNTPGGGWALYGQPGDAPAEWVYYRKKRQRRIYKTQVENVISIEPKQSANARGHYL